MLDVADLAELRRRFREAGDDQQNRSAFNAHLNRQIAEHPDVAALLLAAPEEQQLPVMLLAAVHSIVLAEPDLELAAWYPTTSPELLDGDVFPAFARLCRDREAELQTIVSTRSVQTNEVGRCALLAPALGAVGEEVGKIALIDVGTSAGLNLQLDRYEYRYSPGGHLGESSDVVLECGTRGSIQIPSALPSIASRVGIDRAPVDLSDSDDARWLMACVWPDQRDRFDRLRGAIEIARANPTPLLQGDAVDTVAKVVGDQSDVAHPVVINSWVLNYLPDDRRLAYVELLDQLGQERDLTWIYAESPGLSPGLPFPESLREQHLTVVMQATWRDGDRTVTHLGTGHPHGYWFHAA